MKWIIPSLFVLCFVSCTHKNTNSNATDNAYKSFGAESVSKDVLKKYAPPELASEIKGKISRFMDIQSLGLGVLNPQNKNELFFNWGISGNRQVWKMNGPKSFPQQMTGGKDATTLSGITPDGKNLILERDSDGQEAPGIYMQSTKGGELTKLYHKPKVRASVQFISDDSQFLFFTANEEAVDSFYIYKMNIATKEIEKIWSEKGIWNIMDHEGDKLLLSYQKGNTFNEVFEYNLKTKEKKPIIGQNKTNEYDVSFLKKDNRYLVLTPEVSNFKTLFILENSQLSPLTGSDKYDIESFSLNKKRTLLSYEINHDGYTVSRLEKITPDGHISSFEIPKMKNVDHVKIFFGKNPEAILVSTTSFNSPRTLYSMNLESKKLTAWNTPNAPEMNLESFVPAKLEYYTTRDNIKIPMFVRKPKACEKMICPVLVHFHGGPEGQSLPGFNPLGQLLTENGFIFVEPNVRGSTGYGREWLDSDNGPKREKVITDIEDCALWIKKNWAQGTQTPKVGIFGGSYGGYSTLMGMTYFAGSFDVGVANVGMSNLVTFLENTAPYRRPVRESEYGYLAKDMESLKRLSPINYIDKVKGPLLIIQGANDPRVPVGEAIQMQNAMEKKNLASQLIIFADEGHGAAKKENRILEWGHILSFFKKHLQ